MSAWERFEKAKAEMAAAEARGDADSYAMWKAHALDAALDLDLQGGV
jgi:hypothetical protein